MKGLDELKEEIQEEASDNPEKFFPTDVLKEKGFSRGQCKECGRYFWSKNEEREVCGEPECSGGYTFINNSPTEETYSYIESWELFEDFMTDRGYTSIDRYPVVARWREDVEFTGASIYCFQPDVVSGNAEPPAPELIIPQPSLRFNDVDNVGITGRHYVLHNHIGQTCFQPPEKYDQDRYFRDMFEFAIEGLGIPEEKLILHEDSWGGGGNLGASIEFFVDGLELWNQVYMFYKQTSDSYEELDLKVLDLGMGQERITWISHGSETSYECVMPETLEKMKERTGLQVDQEIWEKFLPYSSELNVDEVDDIEEKWREIAEKIDEDVDQLKKEIKPAAALYSVAEHTRALIFALADGKIPSNTGGGHNLRMIYRRAKDFIERYDWDLDMKEVAKWNAEELEPMFPELLDSIEEIEEILDVEERKYFESRKKAEEKLKELDEQPSLEEMVELYESHGVSPEMMEEHGFRVPEDFYMQIGDEERQVMEKDEKFDIKTDHETEKLYYERREPYRKEEGLEFTAEVEEVLDDWIILDKTMFYPQGGGQEYDEGRLNSFEVVEVQKQDGKVLHHVPGHDFEAGEEVDGKIDGGKREQLTQHHSTTHMVNAAAREKLGNHIFQAGANKTMEKARLDITHYEKPSIEQLDEIEAHVNQIIDKGLDIDALEMQKSEAEQRYGFRIYQGGAPSGNEIRLIKIDDLDIEACGGTHLENSSHAGEFYITGSKRIQDGVIRLEYKAGEAAEKYIETIKKRNKVLADKLGTDPDQNPREVQRKLCSIFSVEPSHLEDTVQRFLDEVEDYNDRINALSNYLETDSDLEKVEGSNTVEKGRDLFETRKQGEKQVEKLESRIEDYLDEKLEGKNETEEKVPTKNVGLLIQVAQKLSRKHDAFVTLIGEEGAVSASQTSESAAGKLEELGSENVQGDNDFAKAFDI